MLNHADATAPKQAPKWDSSVEETAQADEAAPSQGEPPFKGPPANAMAGVLISDWAHGRVDVSLREEGDLV